jgi:hypothetical protein
MLKEEETERERESVCSPKRWEGLICLSRKSEEAKICSSCCVIYTGYIMCIVGAVYTAIFLKNKIYTIVLTFATKIKQMLIQ